MFEKYMHTNFNHTLNEILPDEARLARPFDEKSCGTRQLERLCRTARLATRQIPEILNGLFHSGSRFWLQIDIRTPVPNNRIVEISNNTQGTAMSTVNFSVPEDVKQIFNETFQGQNKSAIIAELMLEAVENAQRRKNSRDAITRILKRRKHAPVVTTKDLRKAREAGRP